MANRYFHFNFMMIMWLLAISLFAGIALGFQLPGWSAFKFPLVVCLTSAGFAWFYTKIRQNEHIVQTALALFAMGLFLQPGLIYSYVTLQLPGTNFDAELSAFDGMLGFDWPALTTKLAEYPNMMGWFGTIYASSALASIISIFVIGMVMEKPVRAHQFVTAVLFSGVFCSTISGLFPVDGFYVYHNISQPVLDAIQPRVGLADMEKINAMRNGLIPSLHLEQGLGVVSFPSFHTILSLLLIWMARGTGWFFILALIWNAAIIFCTPIMGNHYVADVLAGGVVAAASIWLTAVLYKMIDRHSAAPEEAKTTPAFAKV